MRLYIAKNEKHIYHDIKIRKFFCGTTIVTIDYSKDSIDLELNEDLSK